MRKITEVAKLKQVIPSESINGIQRGVQIPLFDDWDKSAKIGTIPIFSQDYPATSNSNEPGYFGLQNRRYLGNKYKLLSFISHIINSRCIGFNVFCDIFAGTGVVSEHFNQQDIKIIANDILSSNYTPLKVFLESSNLNIEKIKQKITILNKIKSNQDNYFSEHFGQTYFTLENARKIGEIRENIEDISENEYEKAALITSLLYAVDKVANTVGHYDAYRKTLDSIQPLKLLIPNCKLENNKDNEVYQKNANQLIKEISCDVLYIDPPYNSRQYSDAYHLVENLVKWEKPAVYGKAKKMERTHIKSEYCTQHAGKAFADLIANADCNHILLSYNNTGDSKDGRSNSRMSDAQIVNILKTRGEVEIFERDYKAFTTGRSLNKGHSERIFYCKVAS